VSGPKSRTEAFHSEEYIYNYMTLTWESQKDENITGALSRQMQQLHHARPLNHRALFLIVLCFSAPLHPDNLALRIFQDVWANYNIAQVLLLLPYVNTTKSYVNILSGAKETIGKKAFHLYTWHPHSSEGNCANVNSINLVDKWLVKTDGNFFHNANLYTNTFSRDFIGCTMKVALLLFPETAVELPGSTNKKYYGLEFNILINILKKLNLSAEFKVFFPANSSNIKFRTDLIEETAYEEVDISVGGLVMSERFKSLVDFTVSYAETAIKWYVPRARYAPCFESAFRMFSLCTWISLFCVSLLVAVLMCVIATRVNKYRSHESYNYMTLQSSAYILWSIFAGVGVPQLPKTSTLRILLSMVLCYSFALTIIFQSYFTSFWINPRFDKQISSVKDILDLGIEYGCTSDIAGYLEGIDESEYQNIKEHRVKCKDQFQCFIRVMKNRNFACIANTFFVEPLLTWGGAKGKVCTISNDIVRLRSVMYLKKGHPLLDRFNKIIRWMTEGGLQTRRANDLYLENKRRAVLSFYYDNGTSDYNNDGDDTNLETGYFPFSVTHLQMAFYSFLIGCILGCVVLVGEILCRM
jgi:hypothetical protein